VLYDLLSQRILDRVDVEHLAGGAAIEISVVDGTERMRIELAGVVEGLADLGAGASVLGGTVRCAVEAGRTVLVIDTPSPR
jgi:hypothetical protein